MSQSSPSIKELMTTPVVTVEMDDTLAVIKDIFDHTHFHHLVVVEEDEIYGLLTDRDLFKALSPGLGTAAENSQDRAALTRPVHQVMSRHPILIDQSQDLCQALKMFEEHHVSCFPVVDDNGKLQGILTLRDLIKAIRVLLK
ncbi:CBS domain-containing protein [Rhabdochromatium marinum]|uniref:CBS domain-containing protein n=1 Tax=Rhabdochromatium marinum TaxID=48729 RepID=UPI00190647ED|nr:CBS domain-containing protein [Rhabdochromatium marinum]MBK1649343.1 CBS domain-containing protein [Rhabdochromatium marinum]